MSRAQDRPAARFDAFATLYERFAPIEDHATGAWLAGVWPAGMVPERVGRALDLGCGTGRFSTLLADHADQVLAVDVSPRMLDLARTLRSRPTITYQRRDVLDVDTGLDGRFDLVLSVHTLHHLHDHDRVLAHVRSLVAPGGHALLADIVAISPHYGSRWWHRRHAVGSATRTLRRRSLADAVVVLRLRTHPRWLDHVTANVPLTRAQFHSTYGAAFPGATFYDGIARNVCALHWQAPDR